MAQVVQAKCPQCKNVLRIPGEWLHLPMRCKHCRQIFQARQKPGGARPAYPVAKPASPPTAIPVGTLAPTRGASPSNPFNFDEPTPAGRKPATARRRRQQGGGWKVGALVG